MITTLLTLEKSLFKYENCRDFHFLNHILHSDFMEYGTSGQIYNREETIALLQTVQTDRPIIIHSSKILKLTNTHWLLHYVSENQESGIISNRSSIWVKTQSHYQMFFHQGTQTDEVKDLQEMIK
ncbi:nuclear transport factor 2 family protein [Macrococcus brunensis]|uniref:nuclear transport factor 2 family protein n=1 Tax=Macrococcus brunensis TaxID=198483 RepID=UPI003083EE76